MRFVYLHVMPNLQSQQLLTLILHRVKISLSHLISILFLHSLSVHDCHAHDDVELGGQVIREWPALDFVFEDGNALCQLLVLKLVDLVDAIQGLNRSLRLDDHWLRPSHSPKRRWIHHLLLHLRQLSYFLLNYARTTLLHDLLLDRAHHVVHFRRLQNSLLLLVKCVCSSNLLGLKGGFGIQYYLF